MSEPGSPELLAEAHRAPLACHRGERTKQRPIDRLEVQRASLWLDRRPLASRSSGAQRPTDQLDACCTRRHFNAT